MSRTKEERRQSEKMKYKQAEALQARLRKHGLCAVIRINRKELSSCVFQLCFDGTPIPLSSTCQLDGLGIQIKRREVILHGTEIYQLADLLDGTECASRTWKGKLFCPYYFVMCGGKAAGRKSEHCLYFTFKKNQEGRCNG